MSMMVAAASAFLTAILGMAIMPKSIARKILSVFAPVVTRRLTLIVLAFALLPVWASSAQAAQSPNVSDAIAWYDMLGYPNVKGLSYVRVATGLQIQVGNQPPENQFVEGFLLREDSESFTVFLCNVSQFTSLFEGLDPYWPLTTVRFIRKASGPEYQQVGYEVLNFPKVADAVLDRVQQHATDPRPFLGDSFSRPATHRARIFAFARASLQQGLPDIGDALMDIAANIPVGQTGKVEPTRLRELLQQQFGDLVLAQAEVDAGNPTISWVDLLKTYADFELRFPASDKVTYARGNANVLRKMIAEDANHHPKPLDQMSPAEQAAEDIYQLRSWKANFAWVINERYPIAVFAKDAQDVVTPVHRLVDLGNDAVPQLIEALDDHSFTRATPVSTQPDFFKAMRISDFAQHILEFTSGRNFFPRKMSDGAFLTTRQQAEAWWAEVQSKGEEEQLIADAGAGGVIGVNAARKLVQKYPNDAISAIEAGIQATPSAGLRGNYVEVAGTLQGDVPVAFLRSQLAPAAGPYSEVQAAKALFARGQPDAVPAMIDAWRTIQSRLPTNQSNAYSEVGYIITFLAKSGDVRAIDALGQKIPNAPVDVRLAIVQVFLPWPKSAGGSGKGPGIHVEADISNLPDGDAGAAIERLLVTALDDKGQRFGSKGTYNEVSYEDPRVCDMAALVLSKRWPERYQFTWPVNAAERDTQIAAIRTTALQR